MLSAAILTGCAGEKVVDSTSVLPKAHVEWPKPVQPCKADFYFHKDPKLATDSEYGVVVVIPYKDWITISKCENEKFTYTSSLTGMVCFYRQDLQEKRCEFYYPPTDRKK